ncbi:hypothetical protein SGRIM119S_02975 [Streptomyces griseorubiginosus]
MILIPLLIRIIRTVRALRARSSGTQSWDNQDR